MRHANGRRNSNRCGIARAKRKNVTTDSGNSAAVSPRRIESIGRGRPDAPKGIVFLEGGMIGGVRRILLGAALICTVSGCTSSPVFELEGLDIAHSGDVLTEFSLGEYKIPIPVAEET